MPPPFSRTLRSLTADGFRPSLVSVSIASVLVVCWLIWFVFARIGVYTTANIQEITREGIIITTLDQDNIERLRIGQPAEINLINTATNQKRKVRATVYNIRNEFEQGRVELFVTRDLTYVLMNRDTLTGTARIRVEQVSPATIITRASSNTEQ